MQNRLEAIDALRALALAGVILMNIGAMVILLDRVLPAWAQVRR